MANRPYLRAIRLAVQSTTCAFYGEALSDAEILSEHWKAGRIALEPDSQVVAGAMFQVYIFSFQTFPSRT